MKGISIAIYIWGAVTGYALGFQAGAPGHTCLTMFPKHDGIQRQLTPCPFAIGTSQSRYSPGDNITVTLSSNSSGITFNGLQIRAHPVYGDTEKIVGHFLEWPVNKTKTLDCFGGKQNLVTHRNSVPVSEVTLIWQAPNITMGDITFVVTFMENFANFWIDQKAYLSAVDMSTIPAVEQKLQVSAKPVRRPRDHELRGITDLRGLKISLQNKVTPTFQVIDWSMCGSEKGCFLYPQPCTGYNCYAAVTYRTVNQSVEFEMFGSQSGYVSVGFSDDKIMGFDETIACTAGDLNIGVQRGYNPELFNDRQYKEGLINLEGEYKDGRLYCRFTRPLNMSVYTESGNQPMQNFDLTEDYYLMLAWGKIYDGTETMGKHEELPPITYDKVNFRENKIVRGSSLPLTHQIHGTLMLVAWMLLVGVVTVIARYFKSGFGAKQMNGVRAWFQIHRAVAITVWLLTAASFVLIFVVLEGLPEEPVAHHYLGIAVMAASTLQVLAGMVRPGLESKIRPAFNIGHWLLGKLTHLTAGIAFYYAFDHEKIPKPQRRFANIVLAVWLGQQVLWEVWFELNQRCKNKNKFDSYQMTTLDKDKDFKSRLGSDPTVTEDNVGPNWTRWLFLYIISLVVISTAALCSIFLF